MDLVEKIVRLRNKYHVPAGQIVIARTPQGEVTYRGGQFVPPEQLENAIVRKSDKSPSGGNENSRNGEAGGPDWNEIAETFKLTNVGDNAALNKASFNINDFVPIPIITSSAKLNPACRFAAQFSVANLLNSTPGLSALLSGTHLTINLFHPEDTPTHSKKIGSKTFDKLGNIDFKNEKLNVWQIGKDPPEIFKNTAHFVSFKLGLLVIHLINITLNEQQKELPELEKELKLLQTRYQQAVQQLTQDNKGKPPKAGQNAEVDELGQNLEQFMKQVEGIKLGQQVLQELKDAVYKEKGIDKHVQDHLDEEHDKFSLGVYENFAKSIALSNMYSFSRGKTFIDGMSEIAKSKPETTQKIKKFLDYLNQITAPTPTPSES